MQLTIRDLTNLLSVEEPTVSRWIKRRGLPAKQVGGQYPVNRADLLAWSTANNVKVMPALFDHLESEASTAPTLAEAIEAGGIHYGIQGSDKQQALRSLVEILPLPEGANRELLLRLFLAREASASAAIGDGIAIPHVQNPIVLHVTRPAISIAFLAHPMDFGAPDGKAVGVLFTIVSPTARCHLRMLSRLSFALHDQRFRESLTRQTAREAILQEVRRVESGLTAVASDAQKAGV
jgi:PTS system nitrogen regulatory IIA component